MTRTSVSVVRSGSPMGPLLTPGVHQQLRAAVAAGAATLECSLDLDRSTTRVEVGVDAWGWDGRRFPYLAACRDRTVYYWTGASFEPVARYAASSAALQAI